MNSFFSVSKKKKKKKMNENKIRNVGLQVEQNSCPRLEFVLNQHALRTTDTLGYWYLTLKTMVYEGSGRVGGWVTCSPQEHSWGMILIFRKWKTLHVGRGITIASYGRSENVTLHVKSWATGTLEFKFHQLSSGRAFKERMSWLNRK